MKLAAESRQLIETFLAERFAPETLKLPQIFLYHGRVADLLTRTFKIGAITKRRTSGNMSGQGSLDFYSPIYADTGARFERSECGMVRLAWQPTWRLKRNVMRGTQRRILKTGLRVVNTSCNSLRLVRPGRV
jgi:hypothetical protein